MSADPWNPQQYERFASERSAPFFDLLQLVEPRPGMRVLDLGCGTGELTVQMAERLDAAEVVGVDSSPAMLEQAAARASARVRFQLADLRTWNPPGRWDLLFSNAALHWIPDHPALLQRLSAAVAPHGQLAIQVPANFDHPSHAVAAELAAEPPYAEALGERRQGGGVLELRDYAVLLHDLGFARQHVRAQVYLHLLPEPSAVVQWTKGSTLTWYREHLGEELYASFESAYAQRLLARLEARAPYPYAFTRYLMWASR